MLKRVGKLVLLLSVAALAWGYWQYSRHAWLNIQVIDENAEPAAANAYSNTYASTPPAVAFTIQLQSATGVYLADVNRVGDYGTYMARHPNANIGTCSHYNNGAVATKPNTYQECFTLYSAWLATWVQQLARVQVTLPNCSLPPQALTVYQSAADWWLWWLPLPHMNGTLYADYSFTLSFNSTTCGNTTPATE
jgi:hypothetical protein